MIRRQLRRSQVIAFFQKLSPGLVGIEACATLHYWAREIEKLGHTVRLMPPAYVKRNKNDAADAEAICEAARSAGRRPAAVDAVRRDKERRAARRADALSNA